MTATPIQSAGTDIPVRALGDAKVPYDVLRTIPEESAEHYRIAPLSLEDGILEVGLVDPDNIQAIDALNFISKASGQPYKIFRIDDADFEKVLAMYRGLRGEVEKAVSDLQTEQHQNVAPKSVSDETSTLDLEDPSIGAGQKKSDNIQEDAPAIKIVSTILRYAIDGK